MNSIVSSARERALASLSASEAQLASVGARYAQIERAALTHQGRLPKQLPQLAQHAQTETDANHRQAAQVGYLGAVQNHHRMESAFQMARRGLLQLGEKLEK